MGKIKERVLPPLVLIVMMGLLLNCSPLKAQEASPEPSPEPAAPEEPVVEPVPEPEVLISEEEPPLRTSAVAGPEIYDFWIDYPRHPACCKKLALTNSDAIALLVQAAPEAISVVVDLSELGVSDVVPLSRPGSIYRAEGIVIGSALSSGTKTITAIAMDAEGNETRREYQVQVDVAAPEIAIAFSSQNRGRLVQNELLYVSGEITDATSVRSVSGRMYPYDAAGVLIPTPSRFITGSHFPMTATGPFSNIGFSTAIEFPPETAMLAFELEIIDDAGNIGYGTTSPMRFYKAGEAPPPPPPASNVLFLPGIKGSRLFGGDEKFWEPGIFQNDIQELFLNLAGKSVRDDVYVPSGKAGVIDEIPGTKIYASFMEDMDELVSSGTINEWQAAPYDWRLSLTDIVDSGLEEDGRIYYGQATSTPYIEQTLRALAATSQTGKVSIVAHSNGGLVAKALMQKLGDAETAALIDDVIFVGVPQSGAPQSLGAILYGYREEIPQNIGLILDAPSARKFAKNSPMGYHLLPSSRYFQDVSDPEHVVAKFIGPNAYSTEISTYGSTIDSWAELKSFLLAEDGGRAEPDERNVNLAAIGNPILTEYAEATHQRLDSWLAPSNVSIYEIGGWGANTIAGIEFYELNIPLLPDSLRQRLYRPIFVEDGDKAVPIPSSLMMPESESVQRYWLDLSRIRNRHEDLLQINGLRDFVVSILQNNPVENETILTEQPPSEGSNSRLIFFLHSPLSLELYDSTGNHVGPNDDGNIDEEVEGSEYGVFGDVQFIVVPAGSDYRIALDGLQEGIFTLEAQEVQSNETISSLTFAGLPATSDTLASLTISGNLDTTSSLTVDVDGDNQDDIVLPPTLNGISTYYPPNTEEIPEEPETTPTETSSIESSGGGSSKRKMETTLPMTSNTTPKPALATTSEVVTIIELDSDAPEITVPKIEPGEVLGVMDDRSSQSAQEEIPSQHNWFELLLAYLYSLLIKLWHWIVSLFV